MSTPSAQHITLCVNRQDHQLTAKDDESLLSVLRNQLQLNGAKYGCGLGECGACTVLIDGIAARACVVPATRVAGRPITTLEGLGTPQGPGPVQQAFIEKQAAQCGYCLNGMIMTMQALLNRNSHPTEEQIRRELKHNLCRCGAHMEILEAARYAVEKHS